MTALTTQTAVVTVLLVMLPTAEPIVATIAEQALVQAALGTLVALALTILTVVKARMLQETVQERMAQRAAERHRAEVLTTRQTATTNLGVLGVPQFH
jgi:ABC-type transport system involved in cytochrome bd biosynthesis fused ATPase/permease subunit